MAYQTSITFEITAKGDAQVVAAHALSQYGKVSEKGRRITFEREIKTGAFTDAIDNLSYSAITVLVHNAGLTHSQFKVVAVNAEKI